MSERKFKVKTSLGSYIAPKETMTESEVREFALQMINDESEKEVWREKIAKDDIGDILRWVNITNITIEEIYES